MVSWNHKRQKKYKKWSEIKHKNVLLPASPFCQKCHSHFCPCLRPEIYTDKEKEVYYVTQKKV